MSDTNSLTRPEVAAFVEEVRRLLADLDDKTREELVGGLEADLSDQLADGARLGDPAAYATELRAAAGLPERPRRAGLGRVPGLAPGATLDAIRARFDELVAHPWIAPGWEILVALRPAWWVLRAWIAVTLLDVGFGGNQGWQISVLPTLRYYWLSYAVLSLAIVGSTLIGMGRFWPGTRGTGARYTLLALNTFAILAPIFTLSFALPGYLTGETQEAVYAHAQPVRDPLTPLMYNGRAIYNLFAYDGKGRPIDGVRLVDEHGRVIGLPRSTTIFHGQRVVFGTNCPVWNGNTESRDLFPLAQLASRMCDTQAEAAGARIPPHPLASLPPVSRAKEPTKR